MDDKDKVYAQCPGCFDGTVHFEVKREKINEESMGVKKDKKISIKITKVNKCPYNLELGDEFEFNQGDKLDEMCPAAFYNIFPRLFTIKKGEKLITRCPDNVTNIEFEVTNE
jgi:uncharacterized repeat protein (TIGR04076 family)